MFIRRWYITLVIPWLSWVKAWNGRRVSSEIHAILFKFEMS